MWDTKKSEKLLIDAMAPKLTACPDKGDPKATAIFTEVKQLESEGYEFESAAASFGLLIRRHFTAGPEVRVLTDRR